MKFEWLIRFFQWIKSVEESINFQRFSAARRNPRICFSLVEISIGLRLNCETILSCYNI